MKYINLSELCVDHTAEVSHFMEDREINERLRDLGIIEGTKIRCVLKGKQGDPSAYLIRGAVIALRRCDACHIMVKEERECP